MDDDPGKLGSSIFGVPIVGRYADIPKVVDSSDISMALIATPAASHEENLSIVELCQRAGVPFKVLPAASTLLDDSINLSKIRDIDPVDLLGRPAAKLDADEIRAAIRGKRVMVTGAAGSVGSELARQIGSLGPGLLCLVDHAENPLMFLEEELRTACPDVFVAALVGNVTDQAEMTNLMSQYRPQVVFHAAAHKHVYLMERTPAEAVKNNVGGTYVTARCAQEAGMETFVFVSTDKAVKPSSRQASWEAPSGLRKCWCKT